MKITYQIYGSCMWHSNCVPGDGNGIMKEVEREKEYSVYECLHYGKKGRYLVGAVGTVCVDEESE